VNFAASLWLWLSHLHTNKKKIEQQRYCPDFGMAHQLECLLAFFIDLYIWQQEEEGKRT
jgi:hypothetical protein